MAKLLELGQNLKREDLSDLLTVIDKRSTPFTSAVKRGSAPKNSLIEWPLDAHKDNLIKGASFTSGYGNYTSKDGADVSASDQENYDARESCQVYVQYARRHPAVSRLANITSDVAGVGWKKEMARSISKALVTHKRDIESVLCSGQDTLVETATANKNYQTRGIGQYLATAQSSNSGSLKVPSNFLTPTTSAPAAKSAIQEEDVRDVLNSIYDQSGEAGSYYGLCGTSMKKKISELTLLVPAARTNNIVASNRDTGSRTLTAMVDVIESDFGTVSLHLSTFLRQDARATGSGNYDATKGQKTLFILNLSQFELAFAEDTNVRELPDLGGGPRTLIESIFALKSYSGGLDHGKLELS